MLDSNSIMFTSLTDIFSIDFDFKNVLNNQFSYHQQALSYKFIDSKTKTSLPKTYPIHRIEMCLKSVEKDS